jgi:DNA gyrase/topoisomerase IV subunit A
MREMETAKEIMDALEASELQKEVEELKAKVTDLENQLKEKEGLADFWIEESRKTEKSYNNLKKVFIQFVEDMKCNGY